MIVAFFGKEILSRFIAWGEKPSVEAAEFEFFWSYQWIEWQFIAPGNLSLSSLFWLVQNLSQCFNLCLIQQKRELWSSPYFRCDSWTFHKMARIENLSRQIVSWGAALVIISQFLRAFAPVAAYLIKFDMISYNFHKFGKYLGSQDHLICFKSVLVDCCNGITCFDCIFVNAIVENEFDGFGVRSVSCDFCVTEVLSVSCDMSSFSCFNANSHSFFQYNLDSGSLLC